MQDDTPTTPVSQGGRRSAPRIASDPAWAALELRLQEALAPRYVLLRQIGAGGMGAVYLAREPELGRLVAVKVLTPDLAKDENSRARFLREAQSAASIAHPNVVAIHSIGALDDGTPYFVMQYATGESIASRLAREGPVTSAEARRMIGELASALAAAHARGIVHRDVKPANVLYDEETGRVLITDFGIAAVRAAPGAATAPSLTGTGMAIGTPQYMSPEQLSAEPANDRTDVYGLGLVAYELLTGAGPFEVTSPMQLMAAHLRDAPRRLSEKRPDVDPEIEELVLACLAKDPAARPSAADIVKRLGAAEVVLEWPAPGLASLQGALFGVARAFAAGATLTAAAFLALFGPDPGLAAQRVSLLTVVLLVAVAIGVPLLGVALFRCARLARRVRRAVRLGYGWTTIAETLADARRDTGLLIAGLREYSALAPAERDTMRRRRVIAAVASFAAGVAPVPMLVVFAWTAPQGSPPGWLAPLVVLGPTLAFLSVADGLELGENRRLRSARSRIARRRSPDDVTDVLVKSWRTSFDAARTGQRLAGGAVGHAPLARVATALLTVVTVATVLGLVPVFYIGVVGSSLWPTMSSLGGAQSKLLIAETVRPLVLPSDSSIAPLEAGGALYLLLLPPGEHPATGHGFVERPAIGPARVAPTQFPPALFTRPVRAPDGKPIAMREGGWAGPNSLGILQYAAGGLSSDERLWLEQLDASPRWELWRRFARAPRVDYIGARFVIPFPDSASAWEFPISRISSLKEMAYASIARAALDRSRGERARADTTMREIVTFGFKLVDNASNAFEELIGIVITGIGQGALTTTNALDGRPPSPESLARQKAVETYTSQREDSLAPASAAELDPRSLKRRILASVTAPHVERAVRMENYFSLALSPCTNVRELLSGPDADARAALSRGRKALARFPSEEALLDLQDRAPSSLMPLPANAPLAPRLMVGLARVSGWILHNPRIPGCVSILAGHLLL